MKITVYNKDVIEREEITVLRFMNLSQLIGDRQHSKVLHLYQRLDGSSASQLRLLEFNSTRNNVQKIFKLIL